jgi:hypothetical protein
MTTKRFLGLLAICLPLVQPSPSSAAELKVSRQALERTLQRQLFNGPDGRYYLKGRPDSACSVYAEDAHLRFEQDRIIVQIKTHARMGKAVGSACLGLSLSPAAEVAVEPYGEGEMIGFRNAQLVKVSDQKELNFLLAPFLRRQIPKGMQVNAADLLRHALAGSTPTTGYQVTLDRLKVHSLQIEGDALVVDMDGDLSVQ